jgi:hypothetical protein
MNGWTEKGLIYKCRVAATACGGKEQGWVLNDQQCAHRGAFIILQRCDAERANATIVLVWAVALPKISAPLQRTCLLGVIVLYYLRLCNQHHFTEFLAL